MVSVTPPSSTRATLRSCRDGQGEDCTVLSSTARALRACLGGEGVLSFSMAGYAKG